MRKRIKKKLKSYVNNIGKNSDSVTEILSNKILKSYVFCALCFGGLLMVLAKENPDMRDPKY